MSDAKKKPPKGGRKGGTRFPQLSLDKAHEYAKKLVSKTHTGPQPSSIVFPGVLGSSSSTGEVKAGAMRQYNLMEGTNSALQATELAKNLNGATPEEEKSFLQEAFLTPKVFQVLYETFSNDTINKTRLRQQAFKQDVHPDSLDKCVEIFIKSGVFAGLILENGDNLQFLVKHSGNKNMSDLEHDQGEQYLEEDNELIDTEDSNIPNENTDTDQQRLAADRKKFAGMRPPRSNIDIRIDPSMDPEKLEKLLQVLRKFGQI